MPSTQSVPTWSPHLDVHPGRPQNFRMGSMSVILEALLRAEPCCVDPRRWSEANIDGSVCGDNGSGDGDDDGGEGYNADGGDDDVDNEDDNDDDGDTMMKMMVMMSIRVMMMMTMLMFMMMMMIGLPVTKGLHSARGSK